MNLIYIKQVVLYDIVREKQTAILGGKIRRIERPFAGDWNNNADEFPY